MIRFLRTTMMIMLSLLITAGLMSPSFVYAEGSGDLMNYVSTEDILQNMTLEQKITQCLMPDFRRWNAQNGETQDMTVLNEEVADIIADYQFGSIILFAQNIKKTEDTVTLTKDLQQASMKNGGLPLLIATDQEGGIVYRLGSGTALPGNMALGATGDSANAKIAGEIIGRELDAVGINTTLAPVIDVNNNPNNTVIGIRAFSDDPDVVGEYGSEYINGLDEYGIIGCAKHFPGHGDTETDSHYGLPVVNKSLDELMNTELKPYKIAISQGIDMIMTAHILYPQIDDTTILSEKTGTMESRPATMSRIILKDILREKLGFGGVVVTDAMNMKGVADHFNAEQSTLEAIRAGVDIICMPITGVYDKDEFKSCIDSIIAYISAAVDAEKAENGGSSEIEERLDESVARILALKQSKGILDYNADNYTVEKALATVGSDENRELEREISATAVTLIKNDNNVLPYKAAEDAKVLMLCPYDNERAQMVMGINRAKAAGKVPESVKVDVNKYSEADFDLANSDRAIIADGTLMTKLGWADLVVINSEVTRKTAMAMEHWTSIGPDLITAFCRKSGKTSVVMSVDKPYDVQLYDNADAILAVYGDKGSSVDVTTALLDGEITADENASGPNIIAGVEVLFGNFKATGKLPVDIPVFSKDAGMFTDEIRYPRGYGLSYVESGALASASLSKSQFAFTGKAIRPSFTVKDAVGNKLTTGKDYSVKYSGNVKVGTAKAVITGTGNYTGTITKTFKIVPGKAKIKKVKAGKRSIRVTLAAKVSKLGGSKYQVAYRYKGSSKWHYKTTTGKTLKISKLKKGRICQVKVRAFKVVDGKRYNGAWSKVVKSGRIK